MDVYSSVIIRNSTKILYLPPNGLIRWFSSAYHFEKIWKTSSVCWCEDVIHDGAKMHSGFYLRSKLRCVVSQADLCRWRMHHAQLDVERVTNLSHRIWISFNHEEDLFGQSQSDFGLIRGIRWMTPWVGRISLLCWQISKKACLLRKQLLSMTMYHVFGFPQFISIFVNGYVTLTQPTPSVIKPTYKFSSASVLLPT